MDIIFQYNSQLALAGIFALVSAIMLASMISNKRILCSKYLKYTWAFFVMLMVSELFSFSYAAFGWAVMSFLTLREYFSLIDLRIQDRIGILVAYLSIPFMMYLITIDWYNMFVISIPVYSFLLIPFLISISGKDYDGAIYSIGTIDFGLFLFVFCLGHLAYLSYYSTWMAVMLILSVAICDMIPLLLGERFTSAKNAYLLRLLIPMPLTVGLSILMLNWTDIPMVHSVILGLMIPALVVIGYHTVRYFELDLGIIKKEMRTGEGQIIDNVKTLLYTSPIVFHYIRYFLF